MFVVLVAVFEVHRFYKQIYLKRLQKRFEVREANWNSVKLAKRWNGCYLLNIVHHFDLIRRGMRLVVQCSSRATPVFLKIVLAAEY